MDDEPRARGTNLVQLLQYQVNSVEITRKIEQDDEIE